ncbi:MAG: flagellar hook-basal body complex protein [Oscillospiraceae bacterium]|nr:flagellar hook-basal body complex protein [Oscillospiraceae bacterium]
MVRSMYSGVAGMKAHQTRMDVIGNNISNVNTYGFKSSRATFRDVYYQTTRGAAAGTSNKGGMNPSQVGYGSTVGSVDVLQTQSALTSTGNPLDVAITGEGFFQVQDADGNIFYTKAGMLDIDSAGNLVDLNGNFVLGVSGNPLGQAPSSNRIQLNIPSVEPTQAKGSQPFNGINYTITASKTTEDGNVSFNFSTDASLPIGQKCKAILTSSGVTVCLNPKETFATVGELETEMNKAITEANGGVTHPGGTFSINMEPSTKFKNLTGAQIVNANFGIDSGSIGVPSQLFGGFSLDSVGQNFGGLGATTYELIHVPAGAANPQEYFVLKVKTAGNAAGEGANTYSARLTAEDLKANGSVVLRQYAGGDGTGTVNGDSDDVITMNFPSYTSLTAAALQNTQTYAALGFTDDTLLPDGYGLNDVGPYVDATGKMVFGSVNGAQATDNAGTPPTGYTSVVNGTADATASKPSSDLGLGKNPIVLTGGTEGGPQTVKDLSSITIGADGVITAYHPVHGSLELGRIDLATFENAQGLQQTGNTYFSPTPNSGQAYFAAPGTGGTGALKNSALEMSNVDLSQEFSDMITTQRGFQANSRLITVSDTMLEELINLKR